MAYFSDKLDIYENYTRGQLCDLLNIPFNTDIVRGVYKPQNYSTIFFFSTINNWAGYINGKISDIEFLYSANSQYTRKELLLFVRIDENTGFYYFGRCKYSHSRDHRLPNYLFPLYCLELLETRFSNVIGIDIPDLFI